MASYAMGHALLDATKAIVIAQCGQAISRLPRRTNMFSSTAAILQDDAGDSLGVEVKTLTRKCIVTLLNYTQVQLTGSTGTIGWIEHAVYFRGQGGFWLGSPIDCLPSQKFVHTV